MTAGPTYESIDAVRFIGNRSSGKMGIAIAEQLKASGAEVTLIAGPSSVQTFDSTMKRINVNTADEMYDACMKHFSSSDIIIMSAAVADYKVSKAEKGKIKKENNPLSLSLTPTIDILSEMGRRKKKNQILIGFALETDNELKNAKSKLQKKNLDYVVLNSLNDEGAGFNHDTNKVMIVDKKLRATKFDLKSKNDVARDIVNLVIQHLK